MKYYCRHFSCQSTKAEEMLRIAERLKRLDFILFAQNILKENQEVRCRHVPRPDLSGRNGNIPLPTLLEEQR